jgi:hypothetical protein
MKNFFKIFSVFRFFFAQQFPNRRAKRATSKRTLKIEYTFIRHIPCAVGRGTPEPFPQAREDPKGER